MVTSGRTATTTLSEGPASLGATVPAPWSLALQGVVVFLRDTAPPGRGLLARYSAVAWVDYASSNVGPYRELLYAERVIRRRGRPTGPSVLDIWVTSQASAISGNANWGLTKSVIDIDRASAGGGAEAWTAANEDGPLGSIVHRPFGPPAPVGKPRGLGRLLQTRDEQFWATPVSFVGLARLTKVTEASFDAARVVDLNRHRIVGALSLTHTHMGFHAATVTPLGTA